MTEEEPTKGMLDGISDLVRRGYASIAHCVDRFVKPIAMTITGVTLFSINSASDSIIESAVTGAVIGGLGDLARQITPFMKKSELKKNGNIAKVYSLDYLQALAEVLAEENGMNSKIKSFDTVTLGSGGTSIFGGGHFDLVTFRYENGKEAKALIKASRKSSSEIGYAMSQVLNERFSFVPNAYSIGRYMLSNLDGDEPWTRFSQKPEDAPIDKIEPCAFEFVEGKSLESFLNSDQPSMENYDWVEDVCEVDKVFDNMFKIYESEKDNKILHYSKGRHHTTLEPFIQVKKLFKRLDDICGESDEFVNVLAAITNEEFENVPLTLIHGDMHQGNVILGDETYIIDWDNAQQGIPYQDFINFAIFTDLDKSSSYEEIKEKFKKRQAEILPGVTEELMVITEFQTYMGWALRFGQETLSGNIKPVDKEHMLSTSKYLLQKSREAIGKYAEMSGKYEIIGEYENFIERTEILNEVDKVDFNPMASVGYAHTTHQQNTTQPLEETAHLNIKKDADYAERVIMQNEKKISPGFAGAAIATLSTGVCVGVCAGAVLFEGGNISDYISGFAALIPLTGLVIGMNTYLYKRDTKTFKRK